MQHTTVSESCIFVYTEQLQTENNLNIPLGSWKSRDNTPGRCYKQNSRLQFTSI